MIDFKLVGKLFKPIFSKPPLILTPTLFYTRLATICVLALKCDSDGNWECVGWEARTLYRTFLWWYDFCAFPAYPPTYRCTNTHART